MIEGLGDLELNEFLSVKTLLTVEVPGAAENVFFSAKDLANRHPRIIGALLGTAPFVFSVLPQHLFAADSLQTGKPAVSTERIGDLIKTLAFPAILGAGNAYRAWHSVSKAVENIQGGIDNKVIEANENAKITSAEDLIWLTIAAQLNLDPEASSEERQAVLSRQNPNILEKLKASAEEELKTIPETVAELAAEIKEMSKKRNKIWRRGAWQIPFEFSQGFLVGCFGMALLQPDGAPTVVEKFLNSTDLVEKAENGFYLSGYVYAAVTATMETWRLQHAAGGRGRIADDAKAIQKKLRQDAGEEIEEDKRPALNDQAKAMAGDRVAKAKMKMKNGK